MGRAFKVALLSLRWCEFGGWVSYKKHLSTALKLNGAEVDCLSLENPKGASTWVRKIKDLSLLSKYDVVHVVLLPTANFMVYQKLLAFGRPLFVTMHDPTELKEQALRFLRCARNRILCICVRPSMLKNKYIVGMPYSTYVPHPYARVSDGVIKGSRIVSTSRVDYDKNTHIILEAGCDIEIWTGHINRIYDYHKLGGVKKCLWYKGKFDSVVDVYSGACALVDLSSIVGDGGGTQYTFLEAMDFGLSLVCNSKWGINVNDELRPDAHYFPVSDAVELRKVVSYLRGNWKSINNDHKYSDILKNHDAKKVGKEMIQIYSKFLSGEFSGFVNSKNVLAGL